MFCPKCGTQLPDDSRFCSKCGSNVEVFLKEAAAKVAPKKTEAAGTAEGGNGAQFSAEKAKESNVRKPRASIAFAGMGQSMPEEPKAKEPKPEEAAEPGAAEEKPEPASNGQSVQQDPGADELLKDIVISDKKFLKVYKNRIVYHGGTVYYKDIATLAAGGSTSKSYGLVNHSTFAGELKMLLYNGEKHQIKVTGTTVAGIGKTKSCEQVFQEILNATYRIIAKEVSVFFIDQINRGAELQLGLARVSKDRMYLRKLIGKKEKEISKEEFGSCSVSGDVFIVGKHGENLGRVASTVGNAYVLPYVLNEIYK